MTHEYPLRDIAPESCDTPIASRDAIAIPEGGWTSGLVEERLVDAVRYAQRTGGRAGPKVFGSAWPDYQHDWADRIAQQSRSDVEKAEEAREQNRSRVIYSSHQVTLAEAALDWSARYVGDEEQRRALALWLLGKATRQAWQALAVKRGIARETAKRRRDRAIHAIVVGLTRDSVIAEGGGL